MLYLVIEYLKEYVHERITSRDLEYSLLAHLRGALRSGDREAARLVSEIDADLVMLSEGLLEEEGFRERIQELLQQFETVRPVVQVAPPTAITAATSDAGTITRWVVDHLPVVTYHRVHQMW